MKLALVCSNYLSLDGTAKKGTEIFNYILIDKLSKLSQDLELTVFASGDSRIPAKLVCIDTQASSLDASIVQKDKHVIFELALISQAFSQPDSFDLYHVNIGDGDLALPLARFITKPVLITLHYTQNSAYIEKYFSLFKQLANVFFVSISQAQRQFFPRLNYAANIYHGIETDKFSFDERGGESMMWAGRGVPDKGLETIAEVLKKLKKPVKLFPLKRKEHLNWLAHQVANLKSLLPSQDFFLEFDKDRSELVSHYQGSKLFLFPIQWEESFGLVLIESLACGTPIVAFARGATPEIIKDGETGFLVNSSDNDIRGDWIIKQTGVAGLIEAIEKIYALPEAEYKQMRLNCRKHAEKYFSAEKMTAEYLKVYQQLTSSAVSSQS